MRFVLLLITKNVSKSMLKDSGTPFPGGCPFFYLGKGLLRRISVVIRPLTSGFSLFPPAVLHLLPFYLRGEKGVIGDKRRSHARLVPS